MKRRLLSFEAVGLLELVHCGKGQMRKPHDPTAFSKAARRGLKGHRKVHSRGPRHIEMEQYFMRRVSITTYVICRKRKLDTLSRRRVRR